MMKVPTLGVSDWGYIENGSSPITVQEWMKEITARVNRLEVAVYGHHMPKSDITLTAKQAEVYSFISRRLDDGESVKLSDICKEFDYSGLSSAQRMVDSLIHKGMVTRNGHQLLIKKESSLN